LEKVTVWAISPDACAMPASLEDSATTKQKAADQICFSQVDG
jgi:hypothetical protein